MATATGNYVCDNSSLANFKQWAMAISAAFAAFGWAQTADTGQVNWSTIASVPSNAFVYEIWKAADTLATTLPIFVKMAYGYSSTSPQLQVTVGTSSDGAGNITGTVISSAPWKLTTVNSNQGATQFPCYFSGDAGEFRMYLWRSAPSSNSCLCFGLERSKDTSGANTAEYFTVLRALPSNVTNVSGNQQTITPAGAGNLENGVIGVGLTNGAGTGYALGTVAAMPVFPVLGKVGNQMLGWAVACANDTADGAIVTVNNLYGATHTYVALGQGQLGEAFGSRYYNFTSMFPLMRYE